MIHPPGDRKSIPMHQHESKRRLSVASSLASWASLRSKLRRTRKKRDIIDSTHSTASNASTRSDTLSDKATPSSKTVRFAPSCSVKTVRSLRQRPKVMRVLWYSPDERYDMKLEARELARKAVQRNHSYVSGIEEAYKAVRYCALTTTSDAELELILNDPDELVRYSRALLAYTAEDRFKVSTASSCRGLEDWIISPSLRAGREDNARELRELAMDSCSQSRSSLVTYSMDSESLARQCRELTRCSTLLARVYGDLDAQVAARNQ